MKKINVSFLDTSSPADTEIRFLQDENDESVMLIEIDTPDDTLRLRMSLDVAKKVATRMYASARKIGGEFGPDRESIN